MSFSGQGKKELARLEKSKLYLRFEATLILGTGIGKASSISASSVCSLVVSIGSISFGVSVCSCKASAEWNVMEIGWASSKQSKEVSSTQWKVGSKQRYVWIVWNTLLLYLRCKITTQLINSLNTSILFWFIFLIKCCATFFKHLTSKKGINSTLFNENHVTHSYLIHFQCNSSFCTSQCHQFTL